SAFTIEAWVRPTGGFGGKGRILSVRGTGTNLASGYSLGRIGDRLEFTTFGLKDYDTFGSYLALDSWTHVAVVFDSNNTANIYVNGQLVESVAGPAPARLATNDLVIGAHHPDGGEN